MVVMIQGKNECNTWDKAFNRKYLYFPCWGGHCSGGGDGGGRGGGFLHNRVVTQDMKEEVGGKGIGQDTRRALTVSAQVKGHAHWLLHWACFTAPAFFFFFPAAPGMCDLSCLTRGWTKPPVTEAWSLNHWTTREVPQPLQLIGKDTPLCGGFKQPKSRCSTLRASAEKAMAPHSSTLAWQIPWMEEPGGLQFMGSLRVRHD